MFDMWDDLCLAPAHHVSGSPGFDAPLSVFAEREREKKKGGGELEYVWYTGICSYRSDMGLSNLFSLLGGFQYMANVCLQCDGSVTVFGRRSWRTVNHCDLTGVKRHTS